MRKENKMSEEDGGRYRGGSREEDGGRGSSGGEGGGREGEAGRLGEEGRVRKGSLCFSGRSRMRQNLRRQLGQRGFAGNLLLQLC